MLQFLSEPEKIRFSELQAKLAQLLISDAEQQELATLVTKAQRSAGERSRAIELVKQLIADNNIDIQSVYSTEAIQRAVKGQQNRGNIRKRSNSKFKLEKAQKKSEQILIQVKLDKLAGAPSRYKKGQKLGKFVSKNFKKLDTNGQLISNLLKYATPLGQSYFATAEGKAELEAFAQFVRTAPLTA